MKTSYCAPVVMCFTFVRRRQAMRRGAAATAWAVAWRSLRRRTFCTSSPSFSSSSPNSRPENLESPVLAPNLPNVWIHRSRSNDLRPRSEGKALLLDGRSISEEIRSGVASEVRRLRDASGKSPGLGVVMVGRRRDSNAFIDIKRKACDEVGIESFVTELPGDCTEDDVLEAVSCFNEDSSVHGIIVQLPLPQHLNEDKITELVRPEKDVDGFHPLNTGNLAMMGREPLFTPCAPKGCIELLSRYGVEIAGKRAVVIGRGKIVGLPISLLLQRHRATVSTIHTLTKNPERITSQADILVSDVGIPNLIRGHWLKPGAVVIDTGANTIKDPETRHGFRVTGDVCYEEAIEVVSAITPVPGGLGPVTISMLLSNVLDSAKRALNPT